MQYKLKKKESLILGGITAFASGLIVGFLLNKALNDHQSVQADDILNDVKERFLEEGPIEGSWIELTKTPVKKAALETDVYYGGISRYEDDELIQYEFIADSNSGTILDIYKL